MRKLTIVVLAIAMLGFGAYLGVSSASAQGEPGPGSPECSNPTFDLNGDHTVSSDDLRTWKGLAGGCFVGAGIAENCAQIIGGTAFDMADVNGDQAVNLDDAQALYRVQLGCTPLPAHVE